MKKVTVLFFLFIFAVCFGFFYCPVEKDIEYVNFLHLVPDTTVMSEPEKEQKTNSQICKSETIRVLLKNSDFTSVYHEQIIFSCDTDILKVTAGRTEKLLKAQTYCLKLSECKQGNIRLIPCGQGNMHFYNIKRKEDVNYQGFFELFGEKEGIVLVNELPVERYLLGVVASEMPSSYPLEALKAQAVVARSYAYYHMNQKAYPQYKADVDDSTGFQVYQNVSGTKKTDSAVAQTENMVMVKENQIQECMYYSTSAGNCPQKEKTFQKYIIKGSQKDIEYEEGWYRWNCQVSISWDTLKYRMLQFAGLSEKEMKVCKEAVRLKKISVSSRAENGRVEEIELKTDAGKIHVADQYIIRKLLAQNGCSVLKKDGTVFLMGEILPSPFFFFEDVTVSKGQLWLTINGGGFGHGSGMSQNGAKNLALRGKDYEEILDYYYDFEIRTG